MPNANGVPASALDLLIQLETFLVANGWTTDRFDIEGTGQRAHFHLGALFVHLRYSGTDLVWPDRSFGVVGNTSINLYCGSGFNPANAWIGQASPYITPLGSGIAPCGVGTILGNGPYSTYYFFCDPGGDNVVVVVEKTPGVFVHFGWGSSLNKAGAWTGGAYFFGCEQSFYTGVPGSGAGLNLTADCPGVRAGAANSGPVCYVRADVDSYGSKWVSIGGGVAGAQGKVGETSVLSSLASGNIAIPVYGYFQAPYFFQFQQTSQQDGRANLLPVLLYVQRDGAGAGFSLLGSLPNIFSATAVGNGYPKGTVYPLGAKNYRLFPNFAVTQS